MDILGRIRLLRNDIQNSNLRKYQKYRAIAKLNGILSSIGTGAVDDAMTKELDASLTNLRQWLDETTEGKFYWQDFRKALQYLLGEVDPNFSNPMYESLRVAALEQQLDQGSVREVEHQYILLKLLWERRKTLPQQAQLQNLKTEAETQLASQTEKIKALKLSMAQEDIFAEADKETWNRLKGKLEIKMPTVDDINRLEAYTPAHFLIETTDKSLADTYLFRHGLKFKWTLNFVSPKPKKTQKSESEEPPPEPGKPPGAQPSKSKKRQTMKLTPVTAEPQVIQYLPTKGTVSV